jgi:hypothetical protein
VAEPNTPEFEEALAALRRAAAESSGAREAERLRRRRKDEEEDAAYKEPENVPDSRSVPDRANKETLGITLVRVQPAFVSFS